jgi:two-component system sensor histidine kinase AtoS
MRPATGRLLSPCRRPALNPRDTTEADVAITQLHGLPFVITILGMSLHRRLVGLLTKIDFWVVLAGLAITTWLHYTTSPLLFEQHTVYRYLYFLPVVYAALRFGLAGGLLAGVTASLLFAPHIWLKFGHFPEESLNDLFVAIILIAVGVLTGALTDGERRQRQKREAASAQLARSLLQLEQRTAALEEMQRYIGNVLASLSSGVVTIDASGRVTTENRVAHTLLGGSYVGQMLPHPLSDPAFLTSGFRQLQLAGRPVGIDASPLAGADGRQMGTVIVLDDLTEIKALEEQVRRAERLSSLGTLAGGVAHEVRNPVGIIRASAQLMGSLPSVAADAGSREYVQVITQEADRVDRLVEDLLGYARAGELSLAVVDVEELVRSTAARLASLAEQAQVKLVVDVEPGLPHVLGDAAKLEQALLNLGLNALTAIEAAYPQPTNGGQVILAARHIADGGLHCVVRDNGQGMADEIRAHIFDPFFTTRDDGTGLGLAIVQRIVADHGGMIEVTSAPDRGATFTIWLPE